MIRNLKLAIAAAMALAMLGAVGASGAQAAEFHCSVEPCVVTPNLDGTAKNSHHVFIIKQGAASAAITCNQITGNATFEGNTTSELTFKEITYDTCSFAGTASEVNMNGCDYLFTSSGQLHLKCPEGASITIREPVTGCTISIGEQTLEGVSYATVAGVPRSVTLSIAVFNIAVTINSFCTSPGFSAGSAIGEYTTGNTVVKGESESGIAAEAWYE